MIASWWSVCKAFGGKYFSEFSREINLLNFFLLLNWNRQLSIKQSSIIAYQQEDTKHFDMSFLNNLNKLWTYSAWILNEALKEIWRTFKTWETASKLAKFCKRNLQFLREVWWRQSCVGRTSNFEASLSVQLFIFYVKFNFYHFVPLLLELTKIWKVKLRDCDHKTMKKNQCYSKIIFVPRLLTWPSFWTSVFSRWYTMVELCVRNKTSRTQIIWTLEICLQ